MSMYMYYKGLDVCSHMTSYLWDSLTADSSCMEKYCPFFQPSLKRSFCPIDHIKKSTIVLYWNFGNITFHFAKICNGKSAKETYCVNWLLTKCGWKCNVMVWINSQRPINVCSPLVTVITLVIEQIIIIIWFHYCAFSSLIIVSSWPH